MYIYILSIKYNNATQNNSSARAIGKLVCSTPFEIPIENVLSQRKLRVGLTVYNGIFLQRRQKLMYHLKYLFFNPFGTDGYSGSHPCFYSIFNRVAHFV